MSTDQKCIHLEKWLFLAKVVNKSGLESEKLWGQDLPDGRGGGYSQQPEARKKLMGCQKDGESKFLVSLARLKSLGFLKKCEHLSFLKKIRTFYVFIKKKLKKLWILFN